MRKALRNLTVALSQQPPPPRRSSNTNPPPLESQASEVATNQQNISFHRFIIPTSGTMGMNFTLISATQIVRINNVHLNSVALKHGIQVNDEILSPIATSDTGSTVYKQFLDAAKKRPFGFDVKRTHQSAGSTFAVPGNKSLHRFIITEDGDLGVKINNDQSVPTITSVIERSLADIYGLQVGDIICKPTGDGSELEEARSFIQQARSSGHIGRSVERPLIVEVLRDVGGERKLFKQKGSGSKNHFNILVPANAKIVVDEDSSDDEDNDCNQVTSNPIVNHVLHYLGAEPCVDEDSGVVAGVMDMGDDVAYTRSETIAQSIASAKRGKAEEMASRDFRKEWNKTISVPIEEIGRRFSMLRVGGRPVEVYPRVGPIGLRRICMQSCRRLMETTTNN